MKHRIIPAILSGGSGTRLWPASTDAKPKQFHALAGARPLIEATLLRVQGETPALSFAPPIVLCNQAHTDLVAEHMRAIGCAPAAIVAEPVGRNTAAAGAVAAALAAEIEPGALVLLLPADHVISDCTAFHDAIERAAPIARTRITTFGIEPTRAETGYGYIKSGELLAPDVFAIESFREKPNAATAQAYLDAGGYAWNAGMFFFHPHVMLEEFEASAAIRDGALAALKAAKRDGVLITLDAELYAATPSLPLDIAVMEKTQCAAIAPCSIGWADIGAWDEIWRIASRDADGNALQGRVTAFDARNNLLRSDGPKVCVAGVEGLIVIATAEAVIIVPRERAQDVKILRDLASKID
jgi:mannose-1-phosphate guanylyltransferase/mannose-6-phosphate isomerase